MQSTKPSVQIFAETKISTRCEESAQRTGNGTCKMKILPSQKEQITKLQTRICLQCSATLVEKKSAQN
jgi:hypothetical protein